MKFNKKILGCAAIVLGLGACAQQADHTDALTQAISVRADEDKARDVSRHPLETLAFFQVAPGMKVAEALPGGGWYSKILANYLGADGALYGINYDDHMWARFGFFTEEQVKGRIASTTKFPQQVATFTDNNITSQGFTFSTAPKTLEGTLDRVLMIRALHNLSRFEKEANAMTTATETAFRLLKKGGMVGVVQHRVPESADDAGANGARGYMKESKVKAIFENAGFTFVASSEINANAKDQPAAQDIVWRLPPTLFGSEKNAEQKDAMMAIGESDRMTLLFKK